MLPDQLVASGHGWNANRKLTRMPRSFVSSVVIVMVRRLVMGHCAGLPIRLLGMAM